MIDKPVYYHIAFYLADNGFGSLGDNIFGGEWGEADKQIACFGGPGTPSELKETYENPGLQILVRGNKREADHIVYTAAKAVSDFLLSLPDSIEISGVCYTGFEPTTDIANLGKDENERFIYSMNFSTYRNRV
jgi:hypothetical protein